MASRMISGGERTDGRRRRGLRARMRRSVRPLLDFSELELALLAKQPPELLRCPVCALGFAVPVRWEALDGGLWRIGLHFSVCGEARDSISDDRHVTPDDFNSVNGSGAMRARSRDEGSLGRTCMYGGFVSAAPGPEDTDRGCDRMEEGHL
jgi:hypothetical protein